MAHLQAAIGDDADVETGKSLVLNRNIGYEDMTQMEDMDLDSLMDNCRLRYSQDQIYTYVGTILVAINPFKRLPIYGPEWLRLYPHSRVGAQPPHVYAVAEATYAAMAETGKDQSVLISGESGAGKTETTKLILRYLTRRSNMQLGMATAAGGKQKSDRSVEKKILESVPILEALGNAKTLRNDNSSRFGKFIEVQFNRDNHIVGSKIIPYLLEKSRVVHQLPGERNFHIFYQLTEGATAAMREQYHLRHAADYDYLNKSGCIALSWANYNEAAALQGFEEALQLFSIGAKARQGMYTILSAILHLGNVGWSDHAVQTGVVELADARSTEALRLAAELLGFAPEQLQYWLSHQRVVIAGETIWKNLTAQQARYLTDSFAKAVYSKLFDWLVRKLNASMHADAAGQKTKNTIGVLDIFGFENFAAGNSFEQFLINYCNEQLQKFFNHYIFALEQTEYEREGIDWSQIDFVDNQATLDLIDLNRPTGILALLDDQCRQPKSTDETYILACHKLFGEGPSASPLYAKPRLKRTHFTLTHYAGAVEYDVTNWLDKNKDELPQHLVQAMQLDTSFNFLSLLFSDSDDDDTTTTANATSSQPSAGSAEALRASSSQSSPAVMQRPATRTTGAYFKQQLKSLMDNLAQTQPHFVRAIKPNLQAKPDHFDDAEIQAQLLYAGMLETIRIRRLGYPVRFSFADFLWKYHVIRPSFTRVADDPAASCRNLLAAMAITARGAQVGKQKVFVKQDTANAIEELRGLALTGAVLKLQTWWRMVHLRQLFLVKKFACTQIQAAWRAHAQRRRYVRMQRAAAVIQLAVRRHQARTVYLRLKAEHAAAMQRLSQKEKAAREARLAAERASETEKFQELLADQAVKKKSKKPAAAAAASVPVDQQADAAAAAAAAATAAAAASAEAADAEAAAAAAHAAVKPDIVVNSKVALCVGASGSYSHMTASVLMFRFHKLRDHTNEFNDFSRDNAVEHIGYNNSLATPASLASAVGAATFSGELFNVNFPAVSPKTTTVVVLINVTSKDGELADKGGVVLSLVDHKSKEPVLAECLPVRSDQHGALVCLFERHGSSRWIYRPLFSGVPGRNYKLSLPAVVERLPAVPRVRAFDVTVQSALGLSLVRDAPPDTYAVCSLDVQTFQTPQAKRTVSPEWKHCGRLVGQAHVFEVRVYAKVGLGSDAFLGSAVINFADNELVMMKDQWLKLDKKGQINVSLVETRPDAPLPEGVAAEPTRRPTLTRRLSQSRLSRMSISLKPSADNNSPTSTIQQLLNIAEMSIKTGVTSTPAAVAEAHARELKKVAQNTVVQRFTFEGLPHHVKTIPLHVDMTAADVLAEVALRIDMMTESLELCERLPNGRLELVDTTSTPVGLDQADLQTPRGSQIKNARQLLKVTAAGRVVLSTRDMVVCPRGWCEAQPALSPLARPSSRPSSSSSSSSKSKKSGKKSSSKSGKSSGKKRSFFGTKSRNENLN